MKIFMTTSIFTLLFLTNLVQAEFSVTMHLVNEKGSAEKVGVVLIEKTKYGVVFKPQIRFLSQGIHGFHVHENASCAPGVKDGKTVAALAAGGHYDPKKTGSHGMPWGDGHLGDLPPLIVNEKGEANQPVLAPRLKMSDLKGRSLMIHEGGDNHADHPAPLGGGGARLVCGVM